MCLWKLSPDSGIVDLIVTGNRHTAAVTTVNFCNLSDQFVSASLDTTLKLWKNEGNAVTVVGTEVAHAKDINCVTVAPNDKIVASASQDKLIKVCEHFFFYFRMQHLIIGIILTGKLEKSEIFNFILYNFDFFFLNGENWGVVLN